MCTYENGRSRWVVAHDRGRTRQILLYAFITLWIDEMTLCMQVEQNRNTTDVYILGKTTWLGLW